MAERGRKEATQHPARNPDDRRPLARNSAMDSHGHPAAAHAHPELSFVRKYIFSTDHKIIGIQFLISTLIFLAIGGTLAMFVRAQLAWPHAELPIVSWFYPADSVGRMPPDFYNMLFTMHPPIMIFFSIIPILAAPFA